MDLTVFLTDMLDTIKALRPRTEAGEMFAQSICDELHDELVLSREPFLVQWHGMNWEWIDGEQNVKQSWWQP